MTAIDHPDSPCEKCLLPADAPTLPPASPLPRVSPLPPTGTPLQKGTCAIFYLAISIPKHSQGNQRIFPTPLAGLAEECEWPRPTDAHKRLDPHSDLSRCPQQPNITPHHLQRRLTDAKVGALESRIHARNRPSFALIITPIGPAKSRKVNLEPSFSTGSQPHRKVAPSRDQQL